MTMEMKKHLLFLCSANLDRSPTAESLFKGNIEYEARSCGLSLLAKKQATRTLIAWADTIFVMDERNDMHKTLLTQRFPEAWYKEIVILVISNEFTRNDPELLRLLKLRLQNYIDSKL